MFICLRAGEAKLYIRESSVYAVRTYGSTVEIHYGPGRDSIAVSRKNNELELKRLESVFGIQEDSSE